MRAFDADGLKGTGEYSGKYYISGKFPSKNYKFLQFLAKNVKKFEHFSTFSQFFWKYFTW